MKKNEFLATAHGKWSIANRAIVASIATVLVLSISGCAKIPCSFTASRYPLAASSIVSDIAKRMQEKGTLAATFAMIEDGEVFSTGAFGWRDKEADLSATDTTLFNFGSCAKVITSTAMMKLVDAGKINLDERVTTYLPEFQMADARASNITVRMLLNHSSGIPGTTARGSITLQPGHDAHMAIALDNLAQDRLKADPGAFSVYCNDGFSVAEMVVAKVSGKRFSQFVKDEIFTPLGMTHSQTADEPYADGSRVANRRALDASPYEIMNVYGSGGFSMTASDWCRMLDMLAGGGLSSNGVRILSEASAAAMAVDQTTSNFWLSNSAGFGLGWDTVGQSNFAHFGITAWMKSGGTDTYTSQVIVIPQYKLGVAISCVGNDLGVADMAVLALETILKRKGIIEGLPAAPDHEAVAALPAEQRAFAGYYGIGNTQFWVHFTDADQLVIARRENGAWSNIYENMTWRANSRYAQEGVAEEPYFQDVAGHGVYLMHAASHTTGKGPLRTSPVAKKLSSYDAPAEAITAWQERAGTWLWANTLPNSHSVGSMTKMVETFDDLPGIVFVNGCALQIQSSDEAHMFLDIPSNPSRDMNDAQIREENGNEWIRFGDVLLRPAEGVSALPVQSSASIVVGAEGFTEWRHSTGTAEQAFDVVLTGTDARWAAYDADFNLVGDSLCGAASDLTVPAGGYVQFLGEPGVTFQVTSANMPADK